MNLMLYFCYFDGEFSVIVNNYELKVILLEIFKMIDDLVISKKKKKKKKKKMIDGLVSHLLLVFTLFLGF